MRTQCRMNALIVGTLFVAGFCRGQVRYSPDAIDRDALKPSVQNLSERLATSALVITAYVVKREHVQTKLFGQQLREMEQLAKEDKDISAKWQASDWGSSLILYRVRVDSTLCQKANFQPESVISEPPREFYLFNPLGPRLDSVTRNEDLQEGLRYLLFVGKDEALDELMGKFDLDASIPYYQVLQYSEGAIELPPEGDQPFRPSGYQSETDLATPVLTAATALCQAVQPRSLFQKIDGLERLRSTSDLGMRKNAEAVIKLLNPSR